LLAATAIMGIAVVTLLVGTSTTFTSSGQNRQSTTAGIVTRDYAEALTQAVSQTTAWCSTTATAYGVAYTPPTGYTVNAVFGACPAAGAAQFQTVTITATEPNGATETLKTVVRQT
jgi:hypothetical protein